MKIRFNYMNHRGEIGPRNVEVAALQFIGTPRWGYQPGWFIFGMDLDKQQPRTFALSRIVFEEEEASTKIFFQLNLTT